MEKEFAALAAKALELIADGSRIGLGSGRTAEAFLQALGKRVGQGLRIRAVATSDTIAAHAGRMGIPIDSLDSPQPLDVTIDGADEVEKTSLNLIKGWGGAMVRERIVAAASRRQIIIVTENKLVDRLGARGKLPVEVVPFAAPFCRRRIEQLSMGGGIKPVLRGSPDHPYVTDNGNWILDCAVRPLNDPLSLDRAIRAIPGVVDTGFFFGSAAVVLVAHGETIQELQGASV
jgi:ribose 5-phosphate isomerase A